MEISKNNRVNFQNLSMESNQSFFRKLQWCCWIILGLIRYTVTKKTINRSYQAMINLHCHTNGFATKLLGRLFSFTNPAKKLMPSMGVLGSYSVQDVLKIKAEIKENGYYVFDQKLSSETCELLKAYAAQEPAFLDYKTTDNRSKERDKAVFNPLAPLVNVYRLPEEELIKNPIVQGLMADSTIRAVASSYINANPILCSVNLWWSAVLGGIPNSEAAQLFHFDMSRASWLNFFIYLTDVDADSGPHCVVKKSHHFNNAKGFELLKKGYVRISDKEIEDAYGTENIVEICGEKGTIIAVDTKCFHKGKPPINKHRLIFELVYASSLFGGEYKNFKKPSIVSKELEAALKEDPKTYVRYN